MTVYVDDMRATYGRMIMCHMIADTEDELHAMATKIGVARRWFQGDHYDICLAKRKLAVRYGAQGVSRRQLAAMSYLIRLGHPAGDPETAPTRMLTAKYVKCPRCGSPAPHLHPAVQFEGEVQPCTDDFHLTPTNQNHHQERS